MPRIYGGTLALIAFSAIIVRGIIEGAPAPSTLLAGSLALPVFFIVGCVIGWIAERTVDESIRANIQTQLNIEQEASTRS